MEHTKGEMIATLNSIYEDGTLAKILAISIVESEHNGEIWFNENKPVDGTQVDYVLHNIAKVFAAPDLLEACKKLLPIAIKYPCCSGTIGQAKQAIAKAEK